MEIGQKSEVALNPEHDPGAPRWRSPQPPPWSLAAAATLWRRFRGSSEFGANAALNVAGNVAQGVIAILSGILSARLLGPRGRGELAAIQTWPVLIGYLAMLGLGEALVYYSAREPARAGTYLGSSTLLALVSCCPFALLGFIFMPTVLSAQSHAVITAARWYLMIIPVIAVPGLLLSVLRGRSDFAVWNVLRLSQNLSWLLILIGAWLIASHSAIALAQSYLVALALLGVLAAAAVRIRVAGSFVPAPRDFLPLLGYGLPCVLTTLPQVMNFRLDQMVMTGLFHPLELGLYVAAVSWSAAINPLLYALASALFPEVASKAKEHERVHAFVRGARLAALAATILGVAVTLATPWAITILFGAGFRPAIPSGLILVPAGAIAAWNQVLEAGLRGLGRPAAVMQAEIAGVVVTAVALWLMLGPLGILGAAIASLLSYLTVTLMLLVNARWATGASIASLVAPKFSDLRAVGRLAYHAKSVLSWRASDARWDPPNLSHVPEWRSVASLGQTIRFRPSPLGNVLAWSCLKVNAIAADFYRSPCNSWWCRCLFILLVPSAGPRC